MNAIPNIRLAEAGDVPALAALISQLGYPVTAEIVAARFRDWAETGLVVLVAVDETGRLLGTATLSRMHVLHRPRPVGRVSMLVVDEAVRGQGVGRALVAAAEVRLAASGCGLLEITSNLRRTDAHAFYEHLGYERTSLRLAKTLAPAD